MKIRLKQNWHYYLIMHSITVLLFFILSSHNVNAQEITISGTVTDKVSGEPLAGASVLIKGTMIGTSANADGTYTLNIYDSGVTLVFSYIGYQTDEILVTDQTVIDVGLLFIAEDLEEIVVVGYGVQKKKLVTGATSQVKNEDLVKNNVNRLESSLQGLTPGMIIVKQSGQPGSDYNISIRGLSSPNDNNPLVLVDGVPGNLNTLNPSDIETVDVLKDAASAAIYGSRAANGVILITTKKGKAGESQITYDAYYGISNASKKVDMLNAKEYAMIMNEASTNVGNDPFFTQGYIDSLGEGTDWQEEAYNKNAPVHSHYLGISGGTEISTYSISLSYNNEEGIFNYEDKSRYERIGVRINSEHKIKKYLKVGENLTYTHRRVHGLGVGNQYNNFLRSLIEASPLIDVYDPDVYDGFGRSSFNDQQINPIASMHYDSIGAKKYDDIIGDIYAELEIMPGLTLRSDFGGSLGFSNTSNALDTFTLTPYTYNAIPTYEQNMERKFYYNIDNTITYEKSFGNHNILAMAGMNAQDNRFFKVKGKIKGYLSNIETVLTNVTTIDTAILKGDYGKGDSRYSYFGRISYNYMEKYMTTISLRRDVSSRFGKNNRVGYFPAVSVGWAISEEKFLEPVSWLNYMKIRASWGQNGKEPSRPYRFLATVGSLDRIYSFGSGWQVGISPDILPNQNLKWEASTQTNIGFDSRFLNNFRFTFDWYRKNSKDWIVPSTVPGISGIAGISTTNPYINGGNVINTGVEFELGYIKNFGDLMIDIRANMAHNKNEVTEVPGEVINGSESVLYNGSEEFYRVEEGYPLGYFWGFVTDGIFQTQEEIDSYIGLNNRSMQRTAKPGDVRRVDFNGDSVINNDDKTMIGDPNPDFIYGFNVAISWRGFDFSMNIQGQAGNQIVRAYRMEERFYGNYMTDILDRWHWIDVNENGIIDEGEGTSNTIPRVTLSSESNQNWRKFGDLSVHDADFLRVKSINIGYDFKSLLRNAPFQRFRIYISATNLLTITKYDGLDPEVGYGSYYDDEGLLQDAYASGIDIGFHPAARTYLIGVNVTF
jgi:TonB-linked SusC/RagA family outer membrane protein